MKYGVNTQKCFGMEVRVNELIKEYGNIVVAAVECVLILGILGYLCVSIATYMTFFADQLMGG